MPFHYTSRATCDQGNQGIVREFNFCGVMEIMNKYNNVVKGLLYYFEVIVLKICLDKTPDSAVKSL